MTRLIANVGASVLQNSALIGANVIVAGTTLTLMSVTMLEHFEDTPEIRTLSCAIGINRSDCPQYDVELQQLKDERRALKKSIAASEHEREKIESQLAGLRAIESSVDEITLFESHSDPKSGTEVTVGTVYKELVNAAPKPHSYFCYINLTAGKAGESRLLHFQGREGPYDVSSSSLKRAGLKKSALKFGRSVCNPFLIGQD